MAMARPVGTELFSLSVTWLFCTLLGFLVVACVMSTLGFSVACYGLCYVIGFLTLCVLAALAMARISSSAGFDFFTASCQLGFS